MQEGGTGIFLMFLKDHCLLNVWFHVLQQRYFFKIGTVIILCLFQISGTLVSDKTWKGSDYCPILKLSFDQTVHITESLYPSVSFPMLFSNLGGSLGFWLGVGLLQICFLAVDFIKYIKSIFHVI